MVFGEPVLIKQSVKKNEVRHGKETTGVMAVQVMVEDVTQ